MAIGLIDRLAGCFSDRRQANLIEHSVRTLIGRRVFGLALGHEDLNDHEQLRHDPVFGALLGWSRRRRVIGKAEHTGDKAKVTLSSVLLSN